jgi:Arc/MetJ-type ribon-helix-helix transcriptional regulator
MNNNVVIDVGAGAYRDAADFLVDLLRFNSRCSAMRKTIKAMTSSDDAIERTWTWFQGAKTERTRRPHAQVLVESLRAAQLDDLEWRRVTDGVKKKAA